MKLLALLLVLAACSFHASVGIDINQDAGVILDCPDSGCLVALNAPPDYVISMSHSVISTYRGEIAWTEDNWDTYLLSTHGCQAVDAGMWSCCGRGRRSDGGCATAAQIP